MEPQSQSSYMELIVVCRVQSVDALSKKKEKKGFHADFLSTSSTQTSPGQSRILSSTKLLMFQSEPTDDVTMQILGT